MTLRISKASLLSSLAIVLVIAADVGGYFIGFAAADRDGAYERGQTAGAKQGEQQGHEAGYRAGHNDAMAEYKPGEPAYERIYSRGRKAGVRVGRAAGYGAGNSDAFAGYDGGWEIGSWYIVHFGQPQGGERYRMESRVPMETGESYNICPNDADEICGGPLY